VNPQPVGALLALDGDGVVEVLRVDRVGGPRRQVAEVRSVVDLGLDLVVHVLGPSLGLAEDLVRELVGDLELLEQVRPLVGEAVRQLRRDRHGTLVLGGPRFRLVV
jgi:hypothetical protein